MFGIDGDEKALLLARRLASALSASACEIPAAVRSHYHLAATMAAGGLVTLLASAAELAARVGLGDEVVAGYLSLAQGALDRAAGSDSIAEAITGPVARGDHEGFAQQIDKVRSLDPALADLLELLAKRTRHHCRDL